MIFALVHYPVLNNTQIEAFRRKYDPRVGLIAPHLTLMFPLPVSVGEDILIHHIKSVLTRWKPFPIHLEGVLLAPDNYLYLLVQEGKDSLAHLHDELYTGLLASYLRTDIPFVPHLTLGILDSDSGNQDSVIQEAKQLDIDHHGVLDKFHLIKVNDDRSRIVWRKDFSLAK
jgi:2'-5' RNA ligase